MSMSLIIKKTYALNDALFVHGHIVHTVFPYTQLT